VEFDLSVPQYDFVTSEAKFPAFVGGVGSGKTFALAMRAILKKAEYPMCNVAYYLPTFDLVRTIAFPTFEKILEIMSAKYRVIKSLTPMIEIENGGQIIMRTMENPYRIVGYEVADSFVDELDIMTVADAKEAWIKILARNRQVKPDGKANTVSVGTTPEGFKFVYEKWNGTEAEENKDGYRMYRASSDSNSINTGSDYVESLRANYPAAQVDAYINGEFVNMQSGAVYPDFDRELNGTFELMNDRDALHIGMDFNVTKMAAVIFVQRGDDPYAVDEITDGFDTPAMIALIKRRYPGRMIFVYPDPHGKARKSDNASVSDISLLHAAGFNVLVGHGNPAVKDRVLSMNIVINSPKGRRMKVNTQMCPAFTTALEQQAYDKNGDPDKKSGLDHCLDAAGYFMLFRYPVINRAMVRVELAGN